MQLTSKPGPQIVLHLPPALQASASTAQHMLSLDTYDLFMRVYQKPVLSSLSELQALLTAQVRYASGAHGFGLRLCPMLC